MSRKTHSQDSNSDKKKEELKSSLEAYKEAAKSDSYIFGDYDGYQAYKDYGDIPD